ncbi:uncharacterized protein [Chelonus insularis]|uniref:uncharacterized protein n=1 Tax=Chelonus insularis TaxID=460826 RepID=UPI00158E2DD2|nr:uncharacterized protein LOC118074682 [Chelonus insularis]
MELQNHVNIIEKKMHRTRRRFETNLPTPPPDPQELDGELEETLPEIENLLTSDYDKLPASTSTSEAVPSSITDAFEHLSKLYGLVDEILNLRNRNSKQFRRIRELEKIKTLKKANSDLEKSLSNGQSIQIINEDLGFAESLLGAMLSSGFELPRRSTNLSRASSSARRSGSLSASIEQRRVSYPVVIEVPRRNSNRVTVSSGIIEKKRPSLITGQPKISKWTRVKAAFKWEKATCNANETGDADFMVQYLKIPDTTTISNEISGPPTPVGTISSSSSIDDVFHKPHRPSNQFLKAGMKYDETSERHDSGSSRRSQSLDGEMLSTPINFNINSRTAKENYIKRMDYRMHKTPWGKMKDIIQLRRDSLARQTSRRNEDNHSTSSLDSTDIHRLEETKIPRVRITSDPSTSTTPLKKSSQSTTEYPDLASRRLTPTLTITVPSSEELRSVSSPESITPPLPRPISESGKSDGSSQSGEILKDRNGQISPSFSNSGILKYSIGKSRSNVNSSEEYKRQQSFKGNSLESSPKLPRRNSKWNKVKRAFLTSATSVPTSPNRVSSYFFDDGETATGYNASASAEDLDDPSNPTVQAEIQHNYRLLYDKLDNEFYRKLAEWEKLKSSSGPLNSKEFSKKQTSRDREIDNLRLLNEDQLTPEFRKKLDEWKRMGKTQVAMEARSNNKRRITDWQLWRSHSKVEGKIDYPGRVSEDFMKKMEEWKRIKATARKDDDHEVKRSETERDNNDNKNFEIETNFNQDKESREKLFRKFKSWKSLEDEEFKPLERVLSAMEAERQTRLSKLHRVVGSTPENTQEILIHTSTGFYRFEGISRKFTRKLYEWEKSQGISPEFSTFRLLDPLRHDIPFGTRKVASNVQMENRSRKNLSRSKSVGSIQIESWNSQNEKSLARRPSSLSLNDMENLDTRSCIVASSVPTIPDEEDTSEEVALEDFDLEPEVEPEAMIVDIEDVIEETASPLTKSQPHQTPVYSVAGSETTSIAVPLGTVTTRHELSPIVLVEPERVQPMICEKDEMIENDFKLIETKDEILGNDKFFRESPDPPSPVIMSSVATTEENVQSSSNPTDEWKITQLNYSEDEDALTKVVITVACNSWQKRQGLKTRRLTDSQVGYKWQNNINSLPDDEKESSKNESSSAITSTTTINTVDTMNEFIQISKSEKIKIDETTLNKIVVPTSSGTLATVDLNPDVNLMKVNTDKNQEDLSVKKERRDPKSMLIKTKKIVFSPFKRENKGKMDPENFSTKTENENKSSYLNQCTNAELEKKEVERLSIPRSPIPARKEYKISPPKDAAPSIKMMIKKYNEKLENSSGHATGSTTSSGSNSPIWRSPVNERRIRDRLEKYQEEVRKAIAGPMYHKNLPTKSATVDFSSKISSTKAENTLINSSPSIVKSKTSPQISEQTVSITQDKNKNSSSTSLRAMMIQKAKEDFLLGVSERITSSNESNQKEIVENHQNNYKNLRVRPKDLQNLSRLDLVKSASVGMINVDSDTLGRLDQLTSRGCDSLPRSSEQWREQVNKCNKESTSKFHQIVNKFKRTKHRKSKEIGDMSTVSVLCRQSLLIDIVGTSKSCPTTPSPKYDNEADQKNMMRKSR